MPAPFDSLISAIYAERMKDLHREQSSLRWTWKRGLRETSFAVPTRAIRSDGTATDIGTITFHYADQNPDGKSQEAWLVRRGMWKQWQAGWLWTTLNGTMVWLAKISPRGVIALNKGWVDKGVMFLNLKK